MSQDERDYWYDPKRFRKEGNQKQEYPKFNKEYEDLYWRKVSQKQQAQRILIRDLIVLATCIIGLWFFFGEAISNYWKSNVSLQSASKNLYQKLPDITTPRPTTAELQFPQSGSIIQYQKSNATTAKFVVVSDQSRTENCVIKLETWNEGIPVIELFVKAGEQAETKLVPLGDYRVKIACGNQWYGRQEMFGRGTQISIGEKPAQLWQVGNTTYGFILTLTKRIDGNFKTNHDRFNSF
jgi:hypothetical protein